MNFNFMCLGVDLTPDMQKAQDIILKDFSQAYVGDFKFVNYGSEKDFMEGLNKAVEHDDIIVLTVQAGLYMAFKDFIARQFKFKVKPQKTIQRLIVGTYPELEKENVQRQADMPTKADVIISEDGLYSGYAIRTDTQIMFVLPLDPTRLDFLLEDGVFPYLRDNLDVSSVQDGDALEGVQPLGKKKKSKKVKKAKKRAWNGIPQRNDADAKKAEKAAEQEEAKLAKEPTESLDVAAIRAAEAENAGAETAASTDSSDVEAEKIGSFGEDLGAEYNKDYIQGVVDTLRLHNTTVALADTRTVDFIKRMANDGVNYDGVISFSNYSFERRKKDAAQYVAKLSKGAFEKTDAVLGAAMTKVYSQVGEDGTRSYDIYVSISDGKTAEEAKVTGEKGETPPHLIYRAVEVLFHMMALWDEKANPEETESAADVETSADAPAAEMTPEEIKAKAAEANKAAEVEDSAEDTAAAEAEEAAAKAEAEAAAEAKKKAKAEAKAKKAKQKEEAANKPKGPATQPKAASKTRYPKSMSKAERKAAQAKAEREAAKQAWKPKDKKN